ncbi:MAG: phenylalanine--tRNA ligase subunit alpha, partial [Candidatus Omnitrophica bacterium]|nr:phenylalanine--tRNA ligase subunit alpha [Candidatus Omnitrophota bacterium]
MLKEIKELQKTAFSELNKAQLLEDIEKVRIKYLGRKSKLSQILKGLKDLTVEQKAEVGKVANIFKRKISQEIEVKITALNEASLWPKIDITMPGIKNARGHMHPITKTIYEICDIFTSLGFNVVEGPEAE